MNGAYSDRLGRPQIVVTGIGIVTSLGAGKAANWAALAAGRSGIREITRFPTDGLRTMIAGTVDFLGEGRVSAAVLSENLATVAIDEAVLESRIGSPGQFPGPLFLALPPAEIEWPERVALACSSKRGESAGYDAMLASPELCRRDMFETYLMGGTAERLADRFGTEGLPVSLSTACASGATAIQLGMEAIRRGEAEAALCVGTDGSVHPETLIRFSLLSALSSSNDPPESASKPFSRNRDGFVMAEGAAALVLESLESATRRRAPILGVLRGAGEQADSFHRTRSNPDGSAIIGAIRRALDDAGFQPDEIDYINTHGTGTPENDKMECLGVTSVFGNRSRTLPVSSNKSMIGHTLSAAGSVEAAFTLLTLQHQVLPPTINYHQPDPMLPLDVVPNTARPAKISRALSNSFGFGGQNVCLAFQLEPA